MTSYQEAQTAFYDENAEVYSDPDHSNEWIFVNRLGRPYKSIETAFEKACRHAKSNVINPDGPIAQLVRAADS